MTVGATTRSKTSRVAENSFGIRPTSPAFVEMPVLSNGMKSNPTRETSSTINPDGQPRQTLETKFDPSGPIAANLTFSNYDGELEAIYRGTWTSKPSKTCVSADTEISDISSEVVTVDAGGSAFKTGMLVLFTGFGGSNEGVIAKVSSSGTTSVTFASGLTDQATIPAGAKMRVIGFQGASGDLVATTTGMTSTVLDFTTLGLNVGEVVWAGGDDAGNTFATAGVGGYAQLKTIAAHALTFKFQPAGWGADAGTGKTVEVFAGDFLKNGTTPRSFTYERQQQDVASPLYEYFTGVHLLGAKIPFDPEKPVALSIDTAAARVPSQTTTRASGASDTAPSSYAEFVTAQNCGIVAMDGLSLAGTNFIMSTSVEITTNDQKLPGLGYKAGINFNVGEIGIKGNISAYLSDASMYALSLNDSYTSETVVLGYAGSTYREAMVFDVPHMKVVIDSDVKGKNQSRMVEGTYIADMHPTLGFTAGLTRLWYRPVVAVA